MQLDRSTTRDVPAPALPLTERVLDRLGSPRWLWIVLWSLLPIASGGVFLAAAQLAGHRLDTHDLLELFDTQIVLAWVCLVFLLGVGALSRQANALEPELARLARGTRPADLFAAGTNVAAPVVLAAVVVVVSVANSWATYGPLPALASMPLLFAYVVAILTFVWVYLSILAGLHRLGGRPLALDRFPEDRTLGLERLGSLASTGLLFLLAGAVPILLAGIDEPVTLAISLAIVAVSVAVFVLSMWRLHGQMDEARERHIALAQRLYREAYDPLRGRPDVPTLEAQATALRAAESLEKRSQDLLTWPLDENTLRFVAVIVTGVVTSLIVRALLAAVGFG